MDAEEIAFDEQSIPTLGRVDDDGLNAVKRGHPAALVEHAGDGSGRSAVWSQKDRQITKLELDVEEVFDTIDQAMQDVID